jgi:hypothetical protein
MTDYQNQLAPYKPPNYTSSKNLEEADTDFMNTNIEYLPLNQPMQSMTQHIINETPINGAVFNKKSQTIQFRLNPEHNSFIDGSQTKLNLTFQAKPVAATGNPTCGVYATGSINNVISKIEIKCGGAVIESVPDANRISHCYTNLYASRSQISSSPSITDLYDSGTYLDVINSAVILNAPIGGKKMSLLADGLTDGVPNLACREYHLSVPINASGFLGPGARKCIPVGWLKESIQVTLFLTDRVEEVYYCKTAGSGATANQGVVLDNSSDYRITNVSLQCKVIKFSESAFAAIRNAHKDNIYEWDGDAYVSNLNQVNPGDAVSRVYLPDTNYKNVKSIINNTWYSVSDTSTITMSCVQPGLYSYNARINGTNCNSRNQGNNNLANLKNSSSQFAMNLLSIVRDSTAVLEADTQISFNYNQSGVGSGLQPYSPYSPDFQTTVLPLPNGPITIPTCNSSQISQTSNKGSAGNCFYTGTSLLRSQDTSRIPKGRDLRNTQVVMVLDRWNAITGSQDQVYQSILHCGVVWSIDMKKGVFNERDI